MEWIKIVTFATEKIHYNVTSQMYEDATDIEVGKNYTVLGFDLYDYI